MTINRRIDHLNAMLVDAAIAVCMTYGHMAAIRLLRGRELDSVVIQRVLSAPAFRRTAAHKPFHT
jgi:hypothetical protein